MKPWHHHYDAVSDAVGEVERAAAFREHQPPPIDEEALAEIGRKHLSRIHIPSIPIPGLGALEKKLIYWICDHTGAPNPFHVLELLTGDGVELQRAEEVWAAAYADVVEAARVLRDGAQPLRAAWAGAEAERFCASLDAYVEQLDVLAGSVRTTWDCLKAIRSEAQLAEGTIQMLINLLVGSLGGLVVAEFITAGTLTPVAAAQAQLELAYVGKKIAGIGGKLNALYSDVTKVLDAIHGFKRLQGMLFVFEVAKGVPEVF
jgi:hypothetical protein